MHANRRGYGTIQTATSKAALFLPFPNVKGAGTSDPNRVIRIDYGLAHGQCLHDASDLMLRYTARFGKYEEDLD